MRYVRTLDSSPASSRFVALITTAFVSGKTAYFWLSRCTSGVYWGGTRPVPHDIYLKYLSEIIGHHREKAMPVVTD